MEALRKKTLRAHIIKLFIVAGIDVFCQIPASVPRDTSAAIQTLRHRRARNFEVKDTMNKSRFRRNRAHSVSHSSPGKRAALASLFETCLQSRAAAATSEPTLAKPWNAPDAPRLSSENRPPVFDAPSRKGGHGHNKAAPRPTEESRATPSHARASKSTPPLAKSLKAAGVHILAATANLRELSDEHETYAGTYLTMGSVADCITISKKEIVNNESKICTAQEQDKAGNRGSQQANSPNLVLEHVEYRDIGLLYLVQKAVAETMEGSGDCLLEDMVALKTEAMTRITAELGHSVVDFCPGTHFTFMNPAMLVPPSPGQDSQLARAHVPRLVHVSQRLLEGYSQLQGSGRRDVVLSLPATAAGLQATRELRSINNRIRICLTHVVSAAHATLCVGSGAACLSVSVGPVMAWHRTQARLYAGIRAENAFARGVEAIQAIIRYCHTARPKIDVIGTEFDNHYQLAALWEFDAVVLTHDQLQALPLLKQKLGPASDRSSYAVLKAKEADRVSTAARERPLDTLPVADVSALASITQRAIARMNRDMEKVERVLTAEIAKALRAEAERRETELDWWDVDGDCWAVIDAARRAGTDATGPYVVVHDDDVGYDEASAAKEVNSVAFPDSSAREETEVEFF
ncbi:hypothetical protein K525DRAFT_241097 [Schizophyllum commune Loenen D]|nr:hypothetical protein K525DRAFT_241097 [Schizophyllum commune Loenen D]